MMPEDYERMRVARQKKAKAAKRESFIVIALAIGIGAAVLAGVAGLIDWATSALHEAMPAVPSLDYAASLALVVLLGILAQVVGMFRK